MFPLKKPTNKAVARLSYNQVWTIGRPSHSFPKKLTNRKKERRKGGTEGGRSRGRERILSLMRSEADLTLNMVRAISFT